MGPGRLVVRWVIAYLTGLAPWLGFVEKSYQSSSADVGATVTNTLLGMEFGPTTFLFLAGQEVYVDYDITIRRGGVDIGIWDHLGKGRSINHEVTSSGAGTASLVISETGLYSISIRPTWVGGDGLNYDVDISAEWGARWP